jgi:hypothetical protein
MDQHLLELADQMERLRSEPHAAAADAVRLLDKAKLLQQDFAQGLAEYAQHRFPTDSSVKNAVAALKLPPWEAERELLVQRLKRNLFLPAQAKKDAALDLTEPRFRFLAELLAVLDTKAVTEARRLKRGHLDLTVLAPLLVAGKSDASAAREIRRICFYADGRLRAGVSAWVSDTHLKWLDRYLQQYRPDVGRRWHQRLFDYVARLVAAMRESVASSEAAAGFFFTTLVIMAVVAGVLLLAAKQPTPALAHAEPQQPPPAAAEPRPSSDQLLDNLRKTVAEKAFADTFSQITFVILPHPLARDIEGILTRSPARWRVVPVSAAEDILGERVPACAKYLLEDDLHRVATDLTECDQALVVNVEPAGSGRKRVVIYRIKPWETVLVIDGVAPDEPRTPTVEWFLEKADRCFRMKPDQPHTDLFLRMARVSAAGDKDLGRVYLLEGVIQHARGKVEAARTAFRQALISGLPADTPPEIADVIRRQYQVSQPAIEQFRHSVVVTAPAPGDVTASTPKK